MYSFAYASTVRTGQHYRTKSIYEETCKIHPYFCIVDLIQTGIKNYSLVLLIADAATFSEPQRDSLGKESRMLFKIVLICLPISFLRDIRTE